MTPYNMVAEFIDKYGQYRRHDGPGQTPLAVVVLRLRLMMEELGELGEALLHGDRAGIADALGDLAYVTVGTAVSMGLPDFTDNADYEQTETPVADIMNHLAASLGELSCRMHQFAMNPDDPAKGPDYVHYQLEDFYDCILDTAYSLGLPFRAIFTEIHNSNMTKANSTIGTQTGHKYGVKLGDNGKGPDYRPPDLRKVLDTYNLDLAPSAEEVKS